MGKTILKNHSSWLYYSYPGKESNLSLEKVAESSFFFQL